MAPEKDQASVRSLDPCKVHLKGLQSSTTPESVKKFIQSLTNEATVQHVILSGSGHSALVNFTEQQDFESLERAIHEDKKGLDGCKIALERVPYCSSILVTGLSRNTTEDAIKFYFENPRTGCGEEAYKIELQEDLGRARLCFENHSALGKLLHKHHTLDDAVLKVEPFYAFLEQEIRKMKIDVDPDIMEYLQKYHGNALQTVLDENALELLWKPKEMSALVKERNTARTLGEDGAAKVNRFENLLEFLKDFEQRVFTVDCNLFEKVAEGISKKIDDKDTSNISLSMDASFSINIIGKKQVIVNEAKQIKKLIEKAAEEKRLEDSVVTHVEDSVVTHVEDDLTYEKLAVLKKSNLIDHLQESYKHTNIDIVKEKGHVIINCPDNKVHEIKYEVLRFLNKIDKKMVRLPERVLEVFLSPKGQEYVRCEFSKQNVNAVLAIDAERKSKDEALIYAVNIEQCTKAVEIVQSFSKEKCIRLQDESMTVLKTKKWKELISQQKEEFVVHISLDTRIQAIWISGVEQDVTKCCSNIQEHIDQYTIFKDSVDISAGNLRFLFKVWNDKVNQIKKEMKKESVILTLVPNYKEMTIQMSGNKSGIKICKERLMTLIPKIRHEKVEVEKQGMAKYFKSSQGSNDIKIVENDHKCTVELVEGKDGLKAERGSTSSSPTDDFLHGDKRICHYKTQEGKTLSVWKDDLTNHPVDVIVNAANNDLKHVGGLAKSIVEAGGQEIQDECDQYCHTNGSVPTGQAMATDSGRLPCKIIVHAVGPRWSGGRRRKRPQAEKEEDKLLYSAIQECLLLAQDYHSMAIPAVSSGIFGFPRDLCASTLIRSVMDFFRDNPDCILSEVRFTNNDDATVNVFEAEIKRVFDEDYSGSDDSKFLTPEGICISVKVGDIAQEKSDVLVNTAGDQLNLQNNACAKAFSNAAGPELQKSCNAIAPVRVGEIGVTAPGNLNCKHVFHAVCGEWKNGSGQNSLCAVLAKCLKEAERRGARSISFPAIGTGVLGFPRDVAAKTSFDEVIKFSRTSRISHLKEVTFVVYHKDQPNVQAFQDEMTRQNDVSTSTRNNFASANPPQRKHVPSAPTRVAVPQNAKPSERQYVPSAPTPVAVPRRKHKFLQIKLNQLTVQVQKGDIIHEKTDAIGMFSNPMMDFELQGAAWAAILRVGGQEIMEERQR